MALKDFIEDVLTVSLNDYIEREDGKLSAWFYVATYSYALEVELTRAELEEIIDFIDDHDGCPNTLEVFEDGLSMIELARRKLCTIDPEVTYLFGKGNPEL